MTENARKLTFLSKSARILLQLLERKLMDILFNFKHTKDINQQKKFELVKDFTSWCMNYLLGKDNAATLIVDCVGRHKIYGQSFRIDKNIFGIEIKSRLNIMDTLCTMAHEIVHIKQMYFMEFNYSDTEDVFYWKTTKYDTDFEDGSAEYYLLPWEIEASGMEYGLVLKWMQEKNISTKEKWFKV